MNETEREIRDELTPRAPYASRAALAEDNATKRARHRESAWHFLTTGESVGLPPYGREWNRDYCPWPYPDAEPADPLMYLDTGIGAVYGIMECDRHKWQLAGWNIVRTGVEYV